MERLSDPEIRSSFVNCSRGEARRLNLPDLTGVRWDDLDFLGWIDPKAPMQSQLVVPTERHGLVGIRMRRNTGAGRRARMCSLCATTHSGQGVSLMVAPRAHQSGRDGNSVGLDICASLQCSLYARGIVPVPALSAVHETLSVEGRVDRVRRNTLTFVDRVMRAA